MSELVRGARARRVDSPADVGSGPEQASAVSPSATVGPTSVAGTPERRRRPYLRAALVGVACGAGVAALVAAVIWFTPAPDRPRPSSVLFPTAVDHIAIDDEERYFDGETSHRVRYGTVQGWLIEGFRQRGPVTLTCLVASAPDRDESAPDDSGWGLVPACWPGTDAGAVPLFLDLPTRPSDVDRVGSVDQFRVMLLDGQVQVFATSRQTSAFPR